MAVDRAAAAEEAPVSHSEDFKMKMHEVLRSEEKLCDEKRSGEERKQSGENDVARRGAVCTVKFNMLKGH